MHVALVHMRHAASGGTERVLDQLARSLADLGHRVSIVCRSHVERPHPAVEFVVLRSAAIGTAWRAWSFAKDAERHVLFEDYDVVVGLGRTWRQDVLRLGGGSHASYLELAHHATLEPWEKSSGKGWLKQKVALTIERRALAPGAYQRVIANSNMVRRDVMQRYAVPESAITLVYNGVDLERFSPERRVRDGLDLRRSLGFGVEHVVVLFLGTGYGRKGLGELLPAFARLVERRPEARLVVAGFDSSRSAYERRARELGLADRATFLGGRKDPETCFGAADLYALPTLYDPFANTTLEALATGLPVITTDTNGASEVLRKSVTGAILPRERDANALAEALYTWTDRDRLRTAAPLARETAERHGLRRMLNEFGSVLSQAAVSRLKRPQQLVESA